MAIIHNLADITDNLSGFDPVAGISDGTTVGNSYILYKIGQALISFDSNLKIVTNSSPTPSWLQSSVGSGLATEPAMNRSVTSDSIRFYWVNDLGLSASTPHCWVWELKAAGATGGNSKISSFIFWVNSSTGAYSPLATTSVADTTTANTGFFTTSYTTSTTVMAYVPKIIFRRSSNAMHLVAINKVTNAYAGMISIYMPVIASAYRPTIGACTHADNIHFYFSHNNNGGMSYIEPFTQNYYASSTARSTATYQFTSCGHPPSTLFTFNSANNMIAGKYKFGLKNDTNLILVTEEIEGLLVVNNLNNSLGNYGGIILVNGTYYLNGHYFSDGLNTFKTLYYLGS